MCENLSNLKKYTERPSPPRPANSEYCRGRTFVGNDGFLWTSISNAKGIFRWGKITGSMLKRNVPAKRKLAKKSPVKRKSPKKSKSPARKRKSTKKSAKKSTKKSAKKSAEICKENFH